MRYPERPLGQQRLNRADVWAQEDLQNAIEGLRELAPSQKSVLHLASCLQDSLQMLVESNEKTKSKFSVRFNGSQEDRGSATKGELTKQSVTLPCLCQVWPRGPLSLGLVGRSKHNRRCAAGGCRRAWQMFVARCTARLASTSGGQTEERRYHFAGGWGGCGDEQYCCKN